MAAKEKIAETVQQAHGRIRAEAIAHFAGKPHGANDRLEWIKEKMCKVKGMIYKPPDPALPSVVVPDVPDPTVTLTGDSRLGALTESPDEGPETDGDGL